MKCQRLPKRLIQLYTVVILLLTLVLWHWTYDNTSSIVKQSPLPQRLQTSNNSSNDTTLSLQISLPYEWPQFTTWKRDGWTFSKIHSTDNSSISFLQGLREYTTIGHTYSQLVHLGRTVQVPHTIDLTVAIYLQGDLQQLDVYLDMISRQTVQPKSIWVLWTSSSSTLTRENISKRLNAITIPSRTVDISKYDAKGLTNHQWIRRLRQISTKWIWLLDMDTEFSLIKARTNNELEYLFRVSQLSNYQGSMLGINGMLLPSNLNKDKSTQFVCLPSNDVPAVSQPADLLYNSWFLERSWLPFILDFHHPMQELPLPYYISQSLIKYGKIATIALPSPSSNLPYTTTKKCITARHDYINNKVWIDQRELHTSPTALDHRQITILRQQKQQQQQKQQSISMDQRGMYLIHGSLEAKYLYPLLCRSQKYPIHIVVTGKDHGMSGKTLKKTMKLMDDCSGNKMAMIHDLNLPGHLNNNEAYFTSRIMDGVLGLMQVLQPEVLIHVSSSDSSLQKALSLASSSQQYGLQWILINLPAHQVQHALWIPDLPLKALKYWNDISIQLVMITDRRPHSFSRLLQTSSNSYFLGDRVDLTIHMEQSADRVTRSLVKSFDWHYGKKTIRHRIQKGGLMPAIVESWYPRNNDDYAVLLEDDISVSPLFYTWAKYNILKYRYGDESERTKQIFGISLYSPRNVELHLVGRRPFDPNVALEGSSYPKRTPYVSQIPCSWGAIYFPEHWREFHSFLTAQLDDLSQYHYLNISLPMSRSDRWKKSWKKYFIQLVYLRGYVMVYPNFQSFESFATNHLETGTHVQSEKRTNIIDLFLVPLMQRDTLLYQLPQQRLPDFDQLPVLDLWGQLVTHDILDERAEEWHPHISACDRRTGTFTPDDLLCPFTHIPAWERPDMPVTTKKIKIYTMTEIVEPLAYVTELTAPMDDDTSWPVAIDVALFSPLLDEIPVEMDDEEKDLRLDWMSIKKLSSKQDTKVEF